MESIWSRASAIVHFFLVAMAAVTLGCFLTTAFKDESVPVDVRVSKVLLRRVDDLTEPGRRRDLASVTFDLSADLQPMFDWNVKQLFLYLTAEYATKRNALNQVVLWDDIVLRGEDERVQLRGAKSKYFFFDDGDGLLGNHNITLTLSWNVVPNAGGLPLVAGGGRVTLPFPEHYETAQKYEMLL
ncbi:signal peptidase complex subunit 3-like [Syngnathoides biaculeatus]|uniref:signal peptidase complex subunit 3-like n=1 Tax=Syngnathoides biaculeatus TaxID=300417 RepID=UPI002ADD42A0|nr:signal peptidase complex subunit 3-like [Syngnathoides biaculeatus]